MASSLLFNRVKVSTATVGTGVITLGSALTSYLDFISGGVVNLNQVSYLIEDGTNYEIGTGTYTSPVTLTRSVIKSSNSNAAISLSGSAVVSITALSTDIVTPDNAQTLTSKTLTSPVISGGTINNASVGATTASTGAFTTLSASSTVSGTGFSTYLASPPAIGGTTAAAITGTTITANTVFAGPINGTIGATTPSTGSFTTLAASSTVSGTGFSTYLASPPAIGGTTAAAITGTTITANTGFVGPHNGTVGATTPSTGSFTTLSSSGTATFNSSVTATGTATGGTVIFGVNNAATIASDVTSQYSAFRSGVTTQAASFNLTTLNHFRAVGPSMGAGSTITNQECFTATPITQATNNYGFVGSLASNATSWNFYASGTAQNAFAGNSRFGGVTAPTVAVDVTGTVAASTSMTIAGNTVATLNNIMGRNRIINGNMYVSQRATSATVTAGTAVPTASTGYPCVDRFFVYSTGANVTAAQVAGATSNRNLLQVTGAASVTAVGIGQRIEALNSIDMAGQTCTLSVSIANSLLTTVTWVASYATTTADTFGTIGTPTKTQIATGTFTVTGTLAQYSANISVPAAATTGIEILFTVGAQISGTWQIGNVQFETGAVVTPFERLSYGTQFQLCQRYFQQPLAWSGTGDTTTSIGASMVLQTPMRASATILAISGSTLSWRSPATDNSSTTWTLSASGNSTVGVWVLIASLTGITAGSSYQSRLSSTNAIINMNAEVA